MPKKILPGYLFDQLRPGFFDSSAIPDTPPKSQNPFANTWTERMKRSVQRTGTPAVLGLDPNPKNLSPLFRPNPLEPEATTDKLAGWCRYVLDQVGHFFAAIKLQSAWFELYGTAGVRAMEQIMRELKVYDHQIIADVKRGDIGVSNDAYVNAWVGGDYPRADVMTLSPWLGPESMRPAVKTLRKTGNGAFVCVRTSNPGAELLQGALVDGEPLWQLVSRMTLELAPPPNKAYYNLFGLVVGAGEYEVARMLREEHAKKRFWILAPGLGAQGASLDNVKDFQDKDGSGVLFPSSRAITFPDNQDIRGAARAFIENLHDALA